MPLNVLLMLSSRQAPDPMVEINYHAKEWACGGALAFIATTRVLSGLIPGESAVAFYGDSRMGNEFLGVGQFEGFLPIESLRAAEIRTTHELYSKFGVPVGMRGFVMISRLRRPRRGETLDAFVSDYQALIRATDKELSTGNLPDGPSRTAVYFTTGAKVEI